ncbi:hypothetical protein ACI2KR_08470 [Pseudomonas luteola]
MKPGLLNHQLDNVQKLLDYGQPVVMNKVEYVQLHKLFMRSPVYRGGELIGHRALEVPSGRLYLMDMVSKMSEEERFDVSAKLTLAKNLESKSSVLEMLHSAISTIGKFVNKPSVITHRILENGEESRIHSPVSGRVVKNKGELPFEIAIDGIDEIGKALTSFDTIWNFAPNSGQAQPQIIQIYGSSHDWINGNELPKIKIINQEMGLSL